MTQDLRKIVDRIPASWGKYVSVGPGWYDIIIELDKNLAALDPAYTIQQVKEKFGGLRYYCEPSENLSGTGLDIFGDLVRQAESLSQITCDVCGGPGKLVNIRGWYSTRCDDDKDDKIESFR